MQHGNKQTRSVLMHEILTLDPSSHQVTQT